MHSGFNDRLGSESAPRIHHCRRCHAALNVPHHNTNDRCRRVFDEASLNIRFVEVLKTKGEPLGLTLRSSASGRCIVARIIHGGLIHRTGLLHVRDEILEINGNPVAGCSIESIQQCLLTSENAVILKIVPSLRGHKPAYQMCVRAMFDYDPRDDKELPCPELSQSFKIGDILEIVDTGDFIWWQARKYNGADSEPTPAGLIPSADLVESRVVKATMRSNSNMLGDAPGVSNNQNHLPGLPNLLHYRRGVGFSASTGISNLEGIGSYLERSFLRWRPFRRIHRSVSRRREGSRRNGRTLERSHSAETFSFTQGREVKPELQQNGHSFEEVSSVGSTNRSRTCSRCNSTLQTVNSTSTTTTTTSAGNSRPAAPWNECAAFLYSEVPFSAYEEVIRLRDFRHRCLVLLGANGVGRRSLRKALVRTRPDIFAQAIPHTTRKPAANERNGEHCYFVQEEEMAADIMGKEFLEFGQWKNILFGIRLDSVRAVISTGRLPVLDVEPRALRILRSAEFAPLVVLLVLPPLNRLLSPDGQHDMLERSLKRLMQESEVLEYVYRPYIDQVIMHRDIEESVEQIVGLVNNARSERWVPIGWTF